MFDLTEEKLLDYHHRLRVVRQVLVRLSTERQQLEPDWEKVENRLRTVEAAVKNLERAYYKRSW